MKKTGDEYFDSDEFRCLLAEYEEAVSTGQSVFMDAEELTEIADYYQCTGDVDRAGDAIDLALSLSPDAVAPLDYLFHEALANNDAERAEEMLDKMIDKQEPEYIYDRAELMLFNSHVREANDYLREEQKNVPEDEMQDYVVDVATLLSQYDQNDLAMEWISESNAEDTPEYKELMAHMLVGIGRYKESQKLFNELIDHSPFTPRYWNGLANAQLMEQDYDLAVESSEYAIAIDPDDPMALMAKANGLYHLNNFEEALEYYQRYNTLVPDDAVGLLYQGICLLNLDRTDDAIKVLEEAEALSDDTLYADIAQELAFAYNDRGETDIALEMLDSIDDDDSNTHSNILVMKGHLLLSADRPEEAEEAFRQAVTINEKPHVAVLRIVISLYDNHYVEGAYRLFKLLFDFAPDDFDDGYAYMALCCYELKRHDEFLKYLKEACQRNPQECRSVLSHLFPTSVKPQDYYNYLLNSHGG